MDSKGCSSSGLERQYHIDDFEEEETLRVSNNIVVKAKDLIGKKTVALKKIPICGGDVAVYMKKAAILKRLQHQNIVCYTSSFVSSSTMCVITEYVEGGNLTKFILDHGKIDEQIPEKKIWDIFHQISLGLSYIHGEKVLHNDLNSSNIFLTHEGVIKIGGFGSAEEWIPDACPSPHANPFTKDIQALGCLLYEMAVGTPLQRDCLVRNEAGEYFTFPSSPYSSQLITVCKECIHMNNIETMKDVTLAVEKVMLSPCY